MVLILDSNILRTHEGKKAFSEEKKNRHVTPLDLKKQILLLTCALISESNISTMDAIETFHMEITHVHSRVILLDNVDAVAWLSTMCDECSPNFTLLSIRIQGCIF